MFILKGIRIYGFAYSKSISGLNMDDINKNIIERYGVDGEKIYYNIMDVNSNANESEYVWLVATNKKLKEDGIYEIVNYLIDNGLIYDYILQSELEII